MTTFDPHTPFNDLPRLPPQREIETIDILKQSILAHRALARLSEASKQIPNEAILISTIPVLEARASSEIENVVTTTDKLFRYAHASGQADAAQNKEKVLWLT